MRAECHQELMYHSHEGTAESAVGFWLMGALLMLDPFPMASISENPDF
jgi:hypothetical protein